MSKIFLFFLFIIPFTSFADNQKNKYQVKTIGYDYVLFVFDENNTEKAYEQDFCFSCIGNTLMIQDFFASIYNISSEYMVDEINFDVISFMLYSVNDMIDIVNPVNNRSIQRKLSQLCPVGETFKFLVIQTDKHFPKEFLGVLCDSNNNNSLTLYKFSK